MPTSFVRKVGQAWLRLLYPPRCVLCQSDLTFEPQQAELERKQILLCDCCVQKLTPPDIRQCRRCSAQLATESTREQERCAACRKERWRFSRVVSLGNYAGFLREAVIELKKEGKDEVALHLGRFLGRQIAAGDSKCPLAQFAGIVCIPTQWRRKILPDTNQSEILAEGISAESGIPVLRQLLTYNRATEKQGLLSASRRRKNLSGSMALRRKRKLRGQKLLIVDDVLTSGATANEAARVLLDNGADSVGVLVIARGVGGK